MKNLLNHDEYEKLIGKKWRNLNQSDLVNVPKIEELDDSLQKFILVSGEAFFRDSKENSTEFQTEDLIAAPKKAAQTTKESDAAMLIAMLDSGKNLILLTEQLINAGVWIENISSDDNIDIRYAFHKTKVASA